MEPISSIEKSRQLLSSSAEAHQVKTKAGREYTVMDGTIVGGKESIKPRHLIVGQLAREKMSEAPSARPQQLTKQRVSKTSTTFIERIKEFINSVKSMLGLTETSSRLDSTPLSVDVNLALEEELENLEIEEESMIEIEESVIEEEPAEIEESEIEEELVDVSLDDQPAPVSAAKVDGKKAVEVQKSMQQILSALSKNNFGLVKAETADKEVLGFKRVLFGKEDPEQIGAFTRDIKRFVTANKQHIRKEDLQKLAEGLTNLITRMEAISGRPTYSGNIRILRTDIQRMI